MITPVYLFSWLLGSLFGFFVSGYMKDPVKMGAFANLLHHLLTALPPVYYPLSLVPFPAQSILAVIPTVALADLARDMAEVMSSMTTAIDLTILISWSAVFLILALKYSRWREA